MYFRNGNINIPTFHIIPSVSRMMLMVGVVEEVEIEFEFVPETTCRFGGARRRGPLGLQAPRIRRQVLVLGSEATAFAELR